MQREREAAGKEFSEADAFAVARVRAYLQTWSTRGQLVSWWQPTLLTVLRKGVLGYAGSHPVAGDLQKRIGGSLSMAASFPLSAGSVAGTVAAARLIFFGAIAQGAKSKEQIGRASCRERVCLYV